MTKIICLMLIGALACQTERPVDEASTTDGQGKNHWEVYEGSVTLDENSMLYMELSIRPSHVTGDGSFRLDEFLEQDSRQTTLASFKGKYSTFHRENPPETVIQLHHSSHDRGVRRTYLATATGTTGSRTRMIREESFRKEDLSLRRHSEDVLEVLDDRQRPLTGAAARELRRRSSRLFTVEGYFRHRGDTADFLEMNTKEVWALSKLGAYNLASRQYYALTTGKYDLVYLKAIGYTVRHTNRAGQQVEALVLKRIIQMSSSPTLQAE